MKSAFLETAHLRLVPQSVEEARAMVAGMPPEARKEVSAEWLARLDATPAPDVWTLGFVMVQRSDGVVAGSAGFKGPPTAGMVEIAYGTEPDYRGKGYATEAARALVDFAFESGLVSVVRAHTLPDGEASKRVLAKCGFKFVGEVMDPEDGLVWRWQTRKLG
ncbi:MAG: GNAT family protein [Verrucomicrobiota bacterium]